MVLSPAGKKTHTSSVHTIMKHNKINCYHGADQCDDLFTVRWKNTNSSPVHLLMIFTSCYGAPWLQYATKCEQFVAL